MPVPTSNQGAESAGAKIRALERMQGWPVGGLTCASCCSARLNQS